MNRNKLIPFPPSQAPGAAQEKAKEIPPLHLPECPFCRREDELEIINWSNERADGGEYIGEAVRCNRCDAVAPLHTWLNLFTANPLSETPKPIPGIDRN